ncbi:MAG TPA: YncE family protein [Terriglobales bacterium]|nr:YncE family protein [Terriglobales bacterium]
MKMQTAVPISLIVLALMIALPAVASGADYKVVNTWKLGGDGGWDYLIADSDGHRLFIARATRVMVIDTESGKQIGEIPDTAGVHGIALDPEIGRGFTSNGREDTVSVFNLKSLAVEKKIKVGSGPDAILYDPFSKRVFTFNGKGQDRSATAIDASKGEVVGKIDLGGKPEFAATDEKGTVFVNIEDTSELVAFDPQKLTVKSRWKLAGCEEPTGLAIDQKNRRLFAGCGGNKKMAIVDADSGKIVASPAIGDGCDATAFDADRGLAFASAGDGTITVIKEDGADKFSVAQTVTTQKGARTMAVDAKTHQLFTVTANVTGTRQDRKVEPDSFVILVVEAAH